jgi:hypothetical protein
MKPNFLKCERTSDSLIKSGMSLTWMEREFYSALIADGLYERN